MIRSEPTLMTIPGSQFPPGCLSRSQAAKRPSLCTEKHGKNYCYKPGSPLGC